LESCPASKVVIRAAEPEDIPDLCRLYSDFHEYHVRGVPDRLASLAYSEQRDTSWLTAKLEEIIQDAESSLFIASVDGKCVGFAESYIREDVPDPARVARRYGYLQSLMVRESFREQGVGKRLLEAAENWARDHAAVEMRLETWEFPGDPVVFYERQGYRTLRRVLVHDL
jgi:aminoglycoside 6'-N-acetyltransferase I